MGRSQGSQDFNFCLYETEYTPHTMSKAIFPQGFNIADLSFMSSYVIRLTEHIFCFKLQQWLNYSDYYTYRR